MPFHEAQLLSYLKLSGKRRKRINHEGHEVHEEEREEKKIFLKRINAKT